jgi:hypothetical protein
MGDDQRPPQVTWYRNGHEQSVQLHKFGLMQLAAAGRIRLRELPVTAAAAELPPELVAHPWRRLVVIAVEHGGERRLAAIDGEDSPFQLSDVLRHVDRYFTCTYAPCFYEERRFGFALPWQTAAERRPYEEWQERVTDRLGHLFHRVRPTAPIGPALPDIRKDPWLTTRLRHLRTKVRRGFTASIDWRPQLAGFEARWSQLQHWRGLQPSADVVLKDSLWGWPRHRIALHRELARLASDGWTVRAELHHRQVEPYELGDQPPPDPAAFPLLVGGGVGPGYETALAASRVGVFATGFHYGWRNIVTLCWAIGLPVLCDPIPYRFPFDHRPLLSWTGGDWSDLEARLLTLAVPDAAARQRRLAHFDAVCSPLAVGQQLLDDCLGGGAGGHTGD